MDPIVTGQHDQESSTSRPNDQKRRERDAHRNLDAITTDAIDQALQLAARVVDDPSRFGRGLPVDVWLASRSEARFVHKRINDALSVGEWLPEVQVLIWDDDEQLDEALTVAGQTAGFEIRILGSLS